MSTGQRVGLDEIPSCFEGIIPASIATVANDGTPNVTYLSVIHRVGDEHVALSRQFFLKTEANTSANPYAQLLVIEGATGRQFRLDTVYERTETSGPLFERMRTALDAVASNEGMSNVFRLKGVDVCRVLDCRMVPCDSPDGPPRRALSFERLQAASARIAQAEEVEELLQTTLDACVEILGFPHAFIMLVDESSDRLYTVASAGYGASGAGSEVHIGEGVIGTAAARRQSVRIANLARERSYTHASLSTGERGRFGAGAERVIPLPSLVSLQSQLVTPMLAHRQLIGVICFQSEAAGAFQSADECAAGVLANQVAMAYASLVDRDAQAVEAPASEPPARALQVKHYQEDDSVFLDNEYLIKGVAGGILWRLLEQYAADGRTEFSNKEIRLDQTLDLPDIKDNLEARLILLRKRLEERSPAIRLEKVARGRFRLVVGRPLALSSISGGSPL